MSSEIRDADREARIRWRALLVVAGVLLLWAVLALWGIPALIRSAHGDESLPIFNRMITGRHKPVDTYLAVWARLAWLGTAALVAVGAAAVVLLPWLSRILAKAVHLKAAPPLNAASLGDLLLSAVWIGIVAGLAEAVNSVVRHRLRHLPTGEIVSGELFWLVPVAAAVSFVALGLFIAGLDRAFRAGGALRRFGPPLFVGLGAYSLLRSLSIGVANLAAVVFALGCAVLAARVLTGRPERSRRFVRRSVPWMAGALAVWGAAVPVVRRWQESRAVSALPMAPPGAPNVLVLIWDAARAQSLSLYGYGRKTTPVLDSLARHGAVFERAFATSAWSLPSHAAIFTGRYPHELSAGHREPLDATHPTLAEVLARQGYATGGFTGNLFYGPADFGLARGFTRYDARQQVKTTVVAHTWWLSRELFRRVRLAMGNEQDMRRRRASHVSDAFLTWVSRRGDRPFFAVLNHFDAHQPYIPPEPFNLAFARTQPRSTFGEVPYAYSTEVLAELLAAYEGSIRYVDHQLGRLLAAMRARGLLENTLVIVTADHGEEFGEHGPDLVGHGRSLYAPVLHVPLVVVQPSRAGAGVRRREVVSIRDIPATVMDALGQTGGHPFPGTSLLRYADGSVALDEIEEPRLSATEKHRTVESWPGWPASEGDMFAVVAGDLHYILDGKKREHLYDLSNDPWERTDLAAVPAMAASLAELRGALNRIAPLQNGVRRVRAIRADERPAGAR